MRHPACLPVDVQETDFAVPLAAAAVLAAWGEVPLVPAEDLDLNRMAWESRHIALHSNAVKQHGQPPPSPKQNPVLPLLITLIWTTCLIVNLPTGETSDWWDSSTSQRGTSYIGG